MNKIKKPTVYLETSMVSYLASRPTEEPIRKAKQILTHRWWELRSRYELFISKTVIKEIVLGDQIAATRRLYIVENITTLQLIPSVLDLIKAVIAEYGFRPPRILTPEALLLEEIYHD